MLIEGNASSVDTKRGDLIRHVITCKNLIGQLLGGAGIVGKKFQYPLCIKTFGRKNHLNDHLSLVHYKLKLLEYVNLERLECLLCGSNSQTFSKLNILIRHVGAGHGKIKEILDENANRPTLRLLYAFTTSLREVGCGE